MTEIENLSKKIADDASKEAQAIKSAASSQAFEILEKSRSDAKRMLDDAKTLAESLYKESYAKRMSRQESDGRQELLRKKMEAAESVLKKAKDEAVKLPKEEYREYFKKNASKISVEDGEFIIGAKESNIDSQFVKSLFRGVKMTESKEKPDFDYGIKVISGRAHYTLSILSDIEYGKEKLLSLINRELFSEDKA